MDGLAIDARAMGKLPVGPVLGGKPPRTPPCRPPDRSDSLGGTRAQCPHGIDTWFGLHDIVQEFKIFACGNTDPKPGGTRLPRQKSVYPDQYLKTNKPCHCKIKVHARLGAIRPETGRVPVPGRYRTSRLYIRCHAIVLRTCGKIHLSSLLKYDWS